MTSQIVDGSSQRAHAHRPPPASTAAWNAPGRRLPEPPRVSKRGDSMTPDLKVPYTMHTARRRRSRDREATPPSRRISSTCEAGTSSARSTTTPSFPRLDPAGGPTTSMAAPARRRRCFRTPRSGQLVPRPDGLAEQATQRDRIAARLVHALEGRGLVHGLSERDPAGEQRRRSGFPPIPRACPADSILRASGTGHPRSAPSSRGVRPVSVPLRSPGGLDRDRRLGPPFTPLAGADLNGDGDGGAFPPDRARRGPSRCRERVGSNSGPCPHR